MADETGIIWADSTFNPWIGCEKVSPGCAHCYAETLVHGRMNRPGSWGPDGVRTRTSASLWAKPRSWERNADAFFAEHGRRRRVFCASLADVFEPRPELNGWRGDLFNLIAATPSLDWLILTKRPEEARDWLRAWYETPISVSGHPGDGSLFRYEGDDNWSFRDELGWGVLLNVWIGASIENIAFTWRADVLRQIPATVRFLSCEPLLGSLFNDRERKRATDGSRPVTADAQREERQSGRGRSSLNLNGIDWVIAGGESGGTTARPPHPQWIRELRDAVLKIRHAALDAAFAAGAPDDVLAQGIADEMTFRDGPAFLFKQWGSWSPGGIGDIEHTRLSMCVKTDGRAATPGSIEEGDEIMVYRGRSWDSGGRHLDGCTWTEFPQLEGAAV